MASSGDISAKLKASKAASAASCLPSESLVAEIDPA